MLLKYLVMHLTTPTKNVGARMSTVPELRSQVTIVFATLFIFLSFDLDLLEEAEGHICNLSLCISDTKMSGSG